uniref:Peptidase S8 pro-domain domain-containing protein n=1 Tax=Denticeps clupeoides TaxID=299321 RepID=A0AAY4CEH5_9TELE
MDLRPARLLPLPLLLTLAVSALSQRVYTNTWAVHVTGGAAEAQRVAQKHGFVNLGHVFGDYYHFRHHRVVKRSLSDHRGLHARLQGEPQVKCVCFTTSISARRLVTA